jgi:hypothetical protein
MALGKITPVTGAALVCAGLLSALVFPLLALGLLRGDAPQPQVPRGSNDRPPG